MIQRFALSLRPRFCRGGALHCRNRSSQNALVLQQRCISFQSGSEQMNRLQESIKEIRLHMNGDPQVVSSRLDDLVQNLRRVDVQNQNDRYKDTWVQALALRTKLHLQAGRFDEALPPARETVQWAGRIDNAVERTQQLFQSYTVILAALSAKLEQDGYDAKLAAEAEDAFFQCANNSIYKVLPKSLLEDFLDWTTMELAQENFSRVVKLVARFLETKMCQDDEIIKKMEILRVVSLLSVGGWEIAEIELRKAQEVSSQVRDLFQSFMSAVTAVEKVSDDQNTRLMMSVLKNLVETLGRERQSPAVGAQLIRIVLSRADLAPILQRQLSAQVAALFIEYGDLSKAEKILQTIEKSAPVFTFNYDEADAEVFLVKSKLIKARANSVLEAGEAPSLSSWGSVIAALIVAGAIVLVRWATRQQNDRLEQVTYQYQSLMQEQDRLISDIQKEKQQRQQEKEALDELRTMEDLKRTQAISSRILKEY